MMQFEVPISGLLVALKQCVLPPAPYATIFATEIVALGNGVVNISLEVAYGSVDTRH